MEQNKDQSGAAVRGEAVSGFDSAFSDAVKGGTGAYIQNADGTTRHIDPNDMMSAEKVSACAADAPSEPSAAIEQIFASWDGCKYDDIDIGAALRADFKTFVFGKSRAADALDSQPTEPDGCAECRHTYCMSGEVCKACGDVAMQGWKGGRQPTDGGVRK